MKKGFSLILIIFLIAVLLIIGGSLARMVLGGSMVSENKIKSLQAFYLAEAGIEKAKYELSKNPDWYTDLPHSPQDDVDWIKNSARGIIIAAPVGTFKIIREKDRERAYSIGSAKNSVRILKILLDRPYISGI